MISIHSLTQIYDVYQEKPLPSLKDSTDFVVSVNPSGVVMWYVYPAKQMRRDAKLYGPAHHHRGNNFAPPTHLWPASGTALVA